MANTLSALVAGVGRGDRVAALALADHLYEACGDRVAACRIAVALRRRARQRPSVARAVMILSRLDHTADGVPSARSIVELAAGWPIQSPAPAILVVPGRARPIQVERAGHEPGSVLIVPGPLARDTHYPARPAIRVGARWVTTYADIAADPRLSVYTRYAASAAGGAA